MSVGDIWSGFVKRCSRSPVSPQVPSKGKFRKVFWIWKEKETSTTVLWTIGISYPSKMNCFWHSKCLWRDSRSSSMSDTSTFHRVHNLVLTVEIRLVLRVGCVEFRTGTWSWNLGVVLLLTGRVWTGKEGDKTVNLLCYGNFSVIGVFEDIPMNKL